MREILFRGKRKDNGEWVEGSLILTTSVKEKTYIVDSCYCYDGCIDEDGYADFDRLNAFEVIPETVGQYTGLPDKNGTKIFEGDILKSESDEYIGVVKYNEIIASFVGEINDTTPKFYHYSLLNKGDVSRTTQLKETVVIGNIHDNPELLKVGDENDT